MLPIPRVVEGILSVPGWSAGAITVGSPSWFSWLTDPRTRSFSFRAPGGTFTARRERRARGGEPVPRIGWRNEEPIGRWVTRRAGPLECPLPER
jgi:hypothetical protein